MVFKTVKKEWCKSDFSSLNKLLHIIYSLMNTVLCLSNIVFESARSRPTKRYYMTQQCQCQQWIQIQNKSISHHEILSPAGHRILIIQYYKFSSFIFGYLSSLTAAYVMLLRPSTKPNWQIFNKL